MNQCRDGKAMFSEAAAERSFTATGERGATPCGAIQRETERLREEPISYSDSSCAVVSAAGAAGAGAAFAFRGAALRLAAFFGAAFLAAFFGAAFLAARFGAAFLALFFGADFLAAAFFGAAFLALATFEALPAAGFFAVLVTFFGAFFAVFLAAICVLLKWHSMQPPGDYRPRTQTDLAFKPVDDQLAMCAFLLERSPMQ